MEDKTRSATRRLCRKCILTDAIPGVSLNRDGVCNLCDSDVHPRAPSTGGASNEQAFLRHLRRTSRGRPQVLFLYSGGKDSTYALYVLSKKIGLRILAITLDNWFLSSQTREDIETTLKHLDTVSHVFIKPAWSLVRSMFYHGFRIKPGSPVGDKAYLLGHACLPCFALITYYSIKTALEEHIPNIVVATTPGQMTQKDIRDLTQHYRSAKDAFRSLAVPAITYLGEQDPEVANALAFSFYEKLRLARLKLVPFYEFVKYDEAEIYRTISRELGWVRPVDTDSCSTNCRVNALGIYVHREWYGISPYCIPLAADVRAGLVGRDEALAQIDGPLDMRVVEDVAKQIGVLDLISEGQENPFASE